jgi:hypothetical protein
MAITRLNLKRLTITYDYKLTLSRDSTFNFHYYSNIKNGIPPEINKYGKGKWTMENNVISFFSINKRY